MTFENYSFKKYKINAETNYLVKHQNGTDLVVASSAHEAAKLYDVDDVKEIICNQGSGFKGIIEKGYLKEMTKNT